MRSHPPPRSSFLQYSYIYHPTHPPIYPINQVDTVANVTWNGHALPGPPPRSSFLQYSYVIPKGLLSASGVNNLSVAIEPALEYTGKQPPPLSSNAFKPPAPPPPPPTHLPSKTGQQREAYPYSVPEVLFFNTWPGYSAKNFLRKTSSDFGYVPPTHPPTHLFS